jgi:hypothetical protein
MERAEMQMRTFFRALTTAAACAVAALPLGAQSTPTPIDIPAGASSAPVLGPQRDAAVAGIRVSAISNAQTSADSVLAPVLKPGQRTRGTSLMVLGTAAFVAGLLIGKDVGTAMAVGGAIVGLYGLYLFLP